MDSSGMELKKRKLEENGVVSTGGTVPASSAGPPLAAGQLQGDTAGGAAVSTIELPAESNGVGVPTYLNLEDARLMVEHLSKEDLASIVSNAILQHRDVLDEVRRITDVDPTRRKIFVRGLGWDTNSHTLRATFSEFGELEEAICIMDKVTGKSRGFGFVTYKHMDGALNALKERSKRIDGRIAVCQLASDGPGSSQPPQDVVLRKIYVGNVPLDWPVDRMLSIFSEYGEIEEGPLGLDKQVGKTRGFALFIYKSAESARRALEEPVKNIAGHQLFCKLAAEGAKQRPMHGQTEMADMCVVAQPGTAGPPSANMPYGATQYVGAPQGMMNQGVPYGQTTNQSLHTGLTAAVGHSMNISAHPNVGGSYPSQTMPANPSLPSTMNPPLGSAVSTGSSQIGTPVGMPSYGGHVGVDTYGQQVQPYGGHQSSSYNAQQAVSYVGQQGGYPSVGSQTSLYNTSQGPVTPQTQPVQSQYGLSSYQTQQQLTHYQGQQQSSLQYQGQQSAPTPASRMQQPGAPSMPYYGM
ncbi:hypothetical protein KP509_26G045600 [Ceratopteris richardii]|nr:hypothetical protein KP509_26G045600 [Ceratopteris richardii]